MRFLKGLFKNDDERFVQKAQASVLRIEAYAEEVSSLTEAEFPKKTAELKERVLAGVTLEDLLPYAFALVREAATRTLGQRHYPVQLIGGIALHEGKIAEMRTGEGKTLVATLSAYLNALPGKGVHVVTVNDYLSRRDAVWMGQIYAYLGLSVGVLNDQNASYLYDPAHQEKDEERDESGSFRVVHEFLRPCTRREAYEADITYGTNNQFGFDYLRDNLAKSLDGIVQRGHAYAIVDEVDSILIDEARTPLIISSQSNDAESLYEQFAHIARTLQKESDYTIDEKHRSIALTDDGIEKAERTLGVDNIYTEKGIKYVHHLETAVRAQALFIRDKEYVVREGQVIIVDPFTGRLQPGRRYSEGLHQAIEAKEGVAVQAESRAVASITFQNFFKFYDKLSGMTGTGKTSEEEFFKVYGLPVVAIPTHREIARKDHNDLIFQTEKGKWAAIARGIKEKQVLGQPVLVGTVSIERNELLSAYLTQAGVKHTVLNAKNHEHEGTIIAEAGKKGSVVIATNMAGRGVDIKLGGALATKEESEEVKALGGLFVLGTERHEARRIDNQLRGRAGRQGDPGETQFYVSLEDDLMRVFGSDRIKTMMGRFGIPEDQPIENGMITRALESAQEKIEGFHFDSRKHTLEYDNVLNHQRGVVYARRRMMLASDANTLKTFADDFFGERDDWVEVIDAKRKEIGDEALYETLRRIVLHVNDMLWVEHLETMEYIRSSVNLRAYGQRDPLIEYRKEGLRLFREMEYRLKEESVTFIKTIDSAPPKESVSTSESKLVIKKSSDTGEGTTSQVSPKVGRNDPCPCGSGKKYKKCHGK